MAKILCRGALLTFPKGKGFELFINWSGVPQKAGGVAGEKKSWRSSAERVIRRPGKLFRSGVRISGHELVLTCYTQPVPRSTAYNADDKQIVFNFYAKEVSEAYEFVITDDEQIERLGKKILDFPQGSGRSAAIRRLCKGCRADITEDPNQDDKIVLEVNLLPLDNDNAIEDNEDDTSSPAGTGEAGHLVKITTQSEKAASTVRYFGFEVESTELTQQGNISQIEDGLFKPRDTKGTLLSRVEYPFDVISDKQLVTEARGGAHIPDIRDFIVSAYSRNPNMGVERGIVMRLFMKGSSDTIVMHLSGMRLQKLVEWGGEPDLLRDCVTQRNDLANNDPEDMVRSDLGVGLERTDRAKQLKKLHERLVSVVLSFICLKTEDGVNSTTEKFTSPYFDDDTDKDT